MSRYAKHTLGLVVFCTILTAFGIYVAFQSWLPSYINYSEYGIYWGGILAAFVCLGPIAYVRAKNIKVDKPKGRFRETLQNLALWFVPAWAIEIVLLIAIGGIESIDNWLSNSFEYETFAGNTVLAFIGFFMMLFPITLHNYYLFSHYKQIKSF